MNLLNRKSLTQLTLAAISLLGGSGVAFADYHSSTFSALINRPVDAFTLDITGFRTSSSPQMQSGPFSYSGTFNGAQWSPNLPLWDVRPICRRMLGCRNDGMRVFADSQLLADLHSFTWQEPETLDETQLRDWELDAAIAWGSDVQPPITVRETSAWRENFSYTHPDGRDAEADTRNFLLGHGFTEENVTAFMVGDISLQELIDTWGEERRFVGGEGDQSDEPPTESELKRFTDNVTVSAEAKAKVKVSESGVNIEAEAGVKAQTNLTNIVRGVGAAAQSAGSAIARFVGSWWHYTKEGADSIGDAIVNGQFSCMQ